MPAAGPTDPPGKAGTQALGPKGARCPCPSTAAGLCLAAGTVQEQAVSDLIRLYSYWRSSAAYRVRTVTGDRFAQGFSDELFRQAGLSSRPSDRDKSQIYLDFAGLLNAGQATLLDVPDVLRQARGLEPSPNVRRRSSRTSAATSTCRPSNGRSCENWPGSICSSRPPARACSATASKRASTDRARKTRVSTRRSSIDTCACLTPSGSGHVLGRRPRSPTGRARRARANHERAAPRRPGGAAGVWRVRPRRARPRHDHARTGPRVPRGRRGRGPDTGGRGACAAVHRTRRRRAAGRVPHCRATKRPAIGQV